MRLIDFSLPTEKTIAIIRGVVVGVAGKFLRTGANHRKWRMFSQSSSAYRTENPDQGKSRAELTEVLAKVNGFDLSYLQENSRGELVQGQLSLLLSPLFTSLIFILVPAGFLGYQLYRQGFIKLFITLNIPLSEVISTIPQGLLIMGVILLLITVLALYFFHHHHPGFSG